MKKIAVICCYNRTDILEALLLEGIKKQKDVEVELVLKKCEKKSKDSASNIFNKTALEVTADYMVFIHQDLLLLDKFCLRNIIKKLEKSPNRVYGLCGADGFGKKRKIYGNIYHGILNRKMGIPVKDEVRVETLDECFLAMTKETFYKIKFDEILLNGWHFYSVDFCLQANLLGLGCYVIAEKAQHKNILEMPDYLKKINIYPKDFYKYARAMQKKYKGIYPYVSSPCCAFSTETFKFYFCYYVPSLVKRRIKYILRCFSL